LQNLLEQAAFESSSMNRKWRNNKLLQVWNEEIEKITDEKRKAYKNTY
jgi:hypothetical protein